MKIIKRTITFITIGLLLLSTPALSAKYHPVTGEILSDIQILNYRVLDEYGSLDPQLINDVDSASVARDLFEGLLTQNADGTLAPGVALRWDTNDAKNLYTFYLRKNALWSDGEPVTANDFVYAWRRAVDPALASPYSWYMELMSVKNSTSIINSEKLPSELGVKAVDDFTFQVELDASLPYFTQMVVGPTTMPVPKKAIDTYGSDWVKPGNMISNGAYILTEHNVNERLVRERNPLYWDNDSTLIDKVVASIIIDENQAVNRYLSGELDSSNIPLGQYKWLKEKYPNEVHSFPVLCTYYYSFNLHKKPFDDIRVRRALSYVVNRDIIVKNIMNNGAIAAYTFTPGATANFKVPNVEFARITQPQRDAKAIKWMAEAGFGSDNPLKMELLYNTAKAHKKIALAISQMWNEKLGVELTLKNTEWKTFLDALNLGDFETAQNGWCGDYNEASTFLNLVNSTSGYNNSKYNNPEVDQLLKDAKTMSNPNENYTKIEQIIADEFPVIPIYHFSGTMLLKPYVRGYPFENVEGNWYSKNMYFLKH